MSEKRLFSLTKGEYIKERFYTMKNSKKILSILLAGMSVMMFGCTGTQENDNNIITAPNSNNSAVEESKAEEINVEIAESSVTKIDSETTTEQNMPHKETTPLFWKVSDEDNTVYLLGTMHALKEEVYPLPDEINNAFDSCNTLAVEADISDTMAMVSAQMNLADIMVYNDGTTVKDHLDSEVYTNVVEYLKANNLYNEQYELYKPAMFFSLASNASIEQIKLDSTKGIDMYLLQNAHNKDKNIVEIEGIEEQYKMLFGFSDDIYNIMLSGYTVENSDKLDEQMQTLYDVWCEGDLEKATELCDPKADLEGEDYDSLSDSEKKAFEQYTNAMYYDRNTKMEQKVEEFMSGSDDVFYAVGLAHFLGDKGIVSLLEQNGYTVEQVKYN